MLTSLNGRDKVKPIGTKENSTFKLRVFSEKNAASILPKFEEKNLMKMKLDLILSQMLQKDTFQNGFFKKNSNLSGCTYHIKFSSEA